MQAPYILQSQTIAWVQYWVNLDGFLSFTYNDNCGADKEKEGEWKKF